jgi:5'-phosphate synthase pdxT subunit
MVFIRAPILEQLGPDVEILATSQGKPVLVRQGHMLIATFHPELTSDATVHEYFLRMASQLRATAQKPSNISTSTSAVPVERS